MKALILCACGLLAGCQAAPYRPVVDSGAPRGDYELDLADCQHLAEQRPVADNAASGAVAGAIFGALIGAAFGLRGNYIGQVAAAGAVNGGAQGAGRAAAEQRAITANCMTRRGYAVVGE